MLFSKRIFTPEKTLKEMMEICFETNKQPAIQFINSSILSFMTTGSLTGI